MFEKILIANRGEIALRVIRACKEIGIKTVAVYSDIDELSLHTKFADEAICIGPSIPKKSYLNIGAIISAAELTNCDAIHPGYGFLSENSEFSKICKEHNICFIGPEPNVIDLMGNKSKARKVAHSLNIPIIPGTKNPIRDSSHAKDIANEIGYPVILKAVSGGGGKGMRVVESDDKIGDSFEIARSEALNSFNDDQIYMEKFLVNPKHIEVQILSDAHDNVYSFGDRDCSIQRNHQKIIEETPSISISEDIKKNLYRDAIKIAREVDYVGAGTVEFLVSDGSYYFIEMNTRIQVEHPITEMVFNVDLVKNQILAHSGEKIEISSDSLVPKGHSIECRVTAENPDKNFMPSPGKVESLHFPGGLGVRIDSHIYTGYKIPPNYDSMVAKIITFSNDRDSCIKKMKVALNEFVIEGVNTIVPFHIKILEDSCFISGDYNTSFLNNFKYIKEKEDEVNVA
ncbi:MAG: acetyl-CoA carboxylase biotin carboxylase subunit [Flavobacteriales bacterium]|nr:acetyl-CoA carboxylase biotin carboxylase subunit [Flavobacteriales bacterium]